MSVLEPEERRPCVFGRSGRVTDGCFDKGSGDDNGADETRIFLPFTCRASGRSGEKEVEDTTRKG